ncbi:Growth hormone-regulated tbc protein 1, partial [Globisporangium splendens]
MEGVLWVRISRGKLLRGWQKRYFILTDDGLLREFAEITEAPAPPTAAGAATATSASSKRRFTTPPSGSLSSQDALVSRSGMMLKEEIDVLGSTMKTLPFPLVGRQFVFQITKKGVFRLSLGAKSGEDMHQWMNALKAVTSLPWADARRQRSPSISGRMPPSAPWTRSPSLEIGTSRTEDDFLDIPVLHPNDMAKFISGYEWVDERVKTTRDITLGGVSIPRGSILVAANGISLQTLTVDEIKLMLKPSRGITSGLRFLRTPYKKGVLKCKMCFSLTTQLKTIAQYRSGLRDWKQQIVEVDGEVLTCYPRADAKSNKARRLIPLTGGCTVKTVHEIVAEQKFCFMVSAKAYSMLFQARSEEEVRHWTEVIQRAIHLAEGVLPGQHDRPSLDNMQLQSSLNMRNLQNSLEFLDADDQLYPVTRQTSVPTDDEWETTSSDGALGSPVHPSSDDWDSATQRAAYLPANDLSEMLFFLQRSGRLVEAFQLMGRNTSHRSEYWKKIFLWALDPIERDAFEHLLALPLADEDNVQVQKDIPRTSKWLAGSAGAPKLGADASAIRLERLERVLQAFLAGCTAHVRTDEEEEEEAGGTAPREGSKNFYMQGMNGLAFILLEVLEEDEIVAFQFFRGIISRILPHVFGICWEGTERDNFDLFSSLVEVGNILQDVVALHLPNFSGAMDDAGIPVCLLAYKWFPTLFSDISLMAHKTQLRFDTLLVIWDICLLMGLEGIFCVSLALFSTAEEHVVGLGRDASAEQISNALVHVISQIKPEDLVTSVCEVLELCSHPVLLKLRNGHRRRLQLGYAKQKYDGLRSQVPAAIGAANSMANRGAMAPKVSPRMTVKDLDSGKLFKISQTGSMLLPVMKAIQ